MKSIRTRASKSLRPFKNPNRLISISLNARAAANSPCGRGLVLLAFIFCVCVAGGVYLFVPESRSQSGGQQVAGDVAGDFSTDYQGSAVYQVSIELPPGTNGQQPNLALVYNSQAKNGIAGVGWSLYGISSVGRCPRLIDPDAQSTALADEADEDDDDPLCLDGVRLVETAPGSYRTEKESWSRIETRGGTSTSPETLVITDRNGTINEFGANENSRVYNRGTNSIRLWMVSKVTDRDGNYVEFTYDNRSKTDGEYYPQFINYTGNARATPQLLPQRQVEFVYEARPDPIRNYRDGSEIVLGKRLQGVRTSVTENGARRVVRFYKCAYDTANSTKRSRITSIRIFDGAGDYLIPTAMAWQDGQNALGASAELARFGDPNVVYGWGDFDGDGKADLLVDQTASPFSHWVLLSQGTRLGPPIELTRFGSQYSTYTWADLNGDGRADLLVDEIQPGQNDNAHYAFLSQGASLGPRIDLRRFGGVGCVFNWTDFNGDGRADLACDENSGQYRHWVLKSNGSGIDAPIFLGVLGANVGQSSWVDFDGDGMSDLVFDQTAEPYLHWARLSDGNSLGGQIALGAFGSDPAKFSWADFNGDGMPDLLFDQIKQSSSFYGHAVRLSTGTNLSGAIQLPSFGQPDASYRWLDFNGDDLADLLVDQMSGASSGHWVSLSSGTSLVTPALSLGAFGATDAGFSWADVNGDGMPDLTSHQRSGQFVQQARLHAGSYPDLLTQIENGIGGQTRIVYKPLTDNAIYSKASGADRAQYPLRDIQSPLYVVAEHSKNDGRENPHTYFFDYTYSGAVLDQTGRGWLGFRTITARDRQTGVRTASTYEQPFPRTGLVTRAVVTSSDGRTLNERNVEFRVSQPVDPRVSEVLKATEALTYYSGKGSNRSYTIAESYTYDAYGNVILEWDKGDIDTTADDLYLCTSYLNDVDDWILGLPLQYTSTNHATIGGSGECVPDKVLTRSRFTYSDDSSRNTLSFESWNDTDDSWLVTSYTYDDFGNMLSITDPVTGRVTMTYDSASQTFPVQSTNALGQTARQRFDAGYGIPVEYTSANNNVFSNQLDGFGRLEATLGPNLKDPQGPPVLLSTVSRQLAATSATAKLFVRTNQRTSWDQADQTKWAWNDNYLDGLNRTWKSESGRFDQPRPIRQDYRFDNEARATQQAQPYYDKDEAFSTVLTYDEQGRVNSTTLPNRTKSVDDYTIVADTSGLDINRNVVTAAPGTSDEATTTTYVSTRGKVTRRVYEKNSDDEPAPEVNYQYDPLLRVTKIEKPNNVATSVRYDSLGHRVSVTDTNSGTTTYAYWPSGLLKTQTNGDGRTVSYAYDVLGRVSSRTTAEVSSKFTYDNAQGNPAITNPLSRLTKVVTTSGGAVQSTYEYSYDAYGRVNKTWLTLDGETFTQATEYDAAGRPFRATYPDGSTAETRYTPEGFVESVGLIEKAGTPDETYTKYATFEDYTALGNYRKASYKNGVVSNYDYYPYGYLKTATTTLPASPAQPLLNFQYTWNNVNTITEIKDGVVPANTQSFTYDKQGYLKSARSEGLYGSLSFDYDAAGNLTLKDQVSYVSDGQRVVAGTKGGATVFKAAYDRVGNMTAKTDDSGSWAYTFDTEGSLLTATLNGDPVYQFTYNYQQRRLIKQGSPDGIKTLYVSGLYEVTKFADGSRRNTKYIVGPAGRVASITTQESAGERTTAPDHGVVLSSRTNALYDVGLLLALVLTLALALRLVSSWHVRGLLRRPRLSRTTALVLMAALLMNSLMLAPPPVIKAQAGTPNAAAGVDLKGVPALGTYFFAQDQINSTTLVTDEGGAKFARVYYKPFGEIYMLEGTDGFRAKFTGQELDEESGLYYYGARYYDPRLGRFISPDVFTIGGPDSSAAVLNQYAYTGNNPIIYNDPTGNIFGIDDAVIFIIVTAVSVAVGTYFGGAAVNHSLNPAKWDWTAPKTYVGMAAGAAIGFVGSEISAGVAGAIGGIGGNIIGGALSGAFENAAYSALGGGSPEQIAEQALTGAALGAAFSGVAAGASRALGRFGKAANAGVADEVGATASQAKSAGARPIIEEPDLSAGRCNCFAADTEVATAKGPTRIQDVQLGDEVWAYNEETGRVELRRVVALFSRKAAAETTVTADGEVIKTTPEHRFWVEGRGWVEAASLRAGDKLVSKSGEELEVSRVESRHGPFVVYNFEVETAHTYFVSRAGVLVHNPCELLKAVWKYGSKKAFQQWSEQSVTRYRGTGNALESAEILSGQLISKAQRANSPPNLFNQSLLARMWHSITSDFPKSQYVSLTRNPSVARYFADSKKGPGTGYVHAFEVKRGEVYRAWWNPWEAEDLIVGGTKIKNPRIVNDKK